MSSHIKAIIKARKREMDKAQEINLRKHLNGDALLNTMRTGLPVSMIIVWVQLPIPLLTRLWQVTQYFHSKSLLYSLLMNEDFVGLTI